MAKIIAEHDGGKIKPPFYKQSYSIKQALELKKCKDDVHHFIKTHVRIIHPVKGEVPFNLYGYQERLLENYVNSDRVICMLPRQTGKLLDLNTPVPTPEGWTTVGEIRVGDTLFGKDGKPAKVTYITPDTWSEESYEFEFDNGDKIVTDKGHLWEVCHSNWSKPKVLETHQIVSHHAKIKNNVSGKYGQIYIESAKPIEIEDKNLEIDPYLFGYWLGDGDSSSSVITLHEDDIQSFREQNFENFEFGTTYHDKRNSRVKRINIKNLHKILRQKDLLSNKHIPLEYLRSSIDQRLALLQGLMDSDGHSNKRNGSMEIIQKREMLIDDIRHLLSSLGIKSTKSRKIVNGVTYFKLLFATKDMPVFRLDRKLENQQKVKGHPKLKRHYIRKITRVESRYMRCLTVDNDDHLFLCGSTFIPTHNTQTSAAYIVHQACFKKKQTIVVAANKGATAKEIMDRIRDMYMELPWYLKPGVTVNNVFELKFDNGSRIIAETTTKDTGRGKSISLLYLDEFAYVNPTIQKDFWTSIQPTLATGGKLIITSTPNTDEDKFANIWFNAEDAENSFEWKDDLLENMGIDPTKMPDRDYETVYEDESMRERYELENKNADATDTTGFKRFFVHWAEHPDRNENFKRKTLSEGITMSEWRREYECAFVSGDETLIDSSKLLALNVYARKPIFIDKHAVHWYEEIKPNTVYGVVLDPCEGTGNDNAVIEVFELPQMVQVAEWAANSADQITQTKQLVRILKRIDDELQDDPDHIGESSIYYSVECNGIGMGILNIIEFDGEENLPGYLIDSDGNKSRGIRTTLPSKRDYSLKLKTFIERNVFVPYSRGLIKELKTFCRRGKGYEAKQGSHDDRVMGCVLMCHMLDELMYYEDGFEEALSFSILSVEEEEYLDDPDDDENLPMPFFVN